jgi:mannose-6-phosphate isomerase-like protein (cupin superfamily)
MEGIRQAVSTGVSEQGQNSHPPRLIDVSSVLGARVWVEDVATETLNDVPITTESEFLPGADSGFHMHPRQDETYQIISGTLDLWLDGEWHRLSDGQSLSIPRGSRHAFRNSSGKPVRVINTHAPGLRFIEYLEGMERLIHEGKLTGLSGFKNTLYVSLYVTRYSDLVIILTPPYAVIQWTARLARLLGYSV